ncbi:uncharacterized protein LOC133795651 [Humulus lupulus]|uniref:uncharacterized protein LOC133795651 n=1 Tax=Humulus lupulus TaxID=3486 RepID=UPI002B406434|nr:uncharacterized protein LOC133795651 [Humulus lupulus]
MFLDTTATILSELNTQFDQGNDPHIFELRETLIALHQKVDSVTYYFTKLKSIWDIINELRPRTPCTCAASLRNLDFHNQEHVLQLLIGLNESFYSVYAQILLIDLFPSLSKVFSMIIQEERQRKLGSFQTPNLLVVTTSTNNFSSKTKKPQPTCTNCKKIGHYVDKCYFLHGFPPGYGDKKNQQGKTHASAHSTNGSADASTSHNIPSSTSAPIPTTLTNAEC